MRMTELEFKTEMHRLESTFSPSAFSFERLELIRRYVADIPARNFARIVDHLIANFRTPPLPKDFKEAASAERNHMADLRSVPSIYQPDFKSKPLKKVLERFYPGCETLNEAIEVEKIKLRVARADENEPDGGPGAA
jgi:hypothetical protein